jgi:hypothetical protein
MAADVGTIRLSWAEDRTTWSMTSGGLGTRRGRAAWSAPNLSMAAHAAGGFIHGVLNDHSVLEPQRNRYLAHQRWNVLADRPAGPLPQ